LRFVDNPSLRHATVSIRGGPVCGDAFVTKPNGSRGQAGLGASTKSATDIGVVGVALAFGHDAFHGGQDKVSPPQARELAIGVGPDSHARVVEAHEQRSHPGRVASEPIEVANDQHVECAGLGSAQHRLQRGSLEKLGPRDAFVHKRFTDWEPFVRGYGG
jgi:hypothetical protein